MTPPTITKTANQLLSALKPSDFSQVARKLTRVKLRPKQIVYKPNAPLDYIYFPENTVLCLLTLMSNGDSIESATVGREGASWISASVGARSMPCETMAVHEGTALKLAVEDLDRELKENRPFRDVLTEYSHALLIASMRTSACNGLHRIAGALRALDSDHPRPRRRRPVFHHEGISRTAAGHEPADGQRHGGRIREGRDSQRGRPSGHRCRSKTAEGRLL